MKQLSVGTGIVVAAVIAAVTTLAVVALITHRPDRPPLTSRQVATAAPSPTASQDERMSEAVADGQGTYIGQAGDGPPLPTSLAGQRYSCLVAADTSQCMVIYVRDPATGWCIEMDYIAPKAVGTEQGWRKATDDPADYLCSD